MFQWTDRWLDKHIHNEKWNRLLKKIISKEMFLYIVFGVLTTVVALVSFRIFQRTIGKQYAPINNVLSWILAVAFAFITNKFFVFESKSTESGILWKEILSFVTARLLSLGVEELIILIAQYVFHGADVTCLIIAGKDFDGIDVAKLIAQVIIVIMNYVLSKLIVFKKKSS